MPPFSEPESSGMATFPSTSFYHPIQASTYQQAMPAYTTDGYPHRGSLDSISRVSQSGAITQGLSNPYDATTSLSMQTSHSTTVKVEDSAPAYGSQTSFYTGQIVASPTDRIEIGLAAAGTDLDFATDIDTLMKAIQTKAKVISAPPISSSQGNGSLATRSQEHVRYALPGQPELHSVSSLHAPSADRGEDVADRKAKKRYECDQPGCEKEFFQKTHLEIHMRAHTGVKPFVGATFAGPVKGPSGREASLRSKRGSGPLMVRTALQGVSLWPAIFPARQSEGG